MWRSLLSVCTVLLVSGVCGADDWATPTPRIFAAESGSHAFRVTPVDEKPWELGTGTLFQPAAKGSDTVLWKRELVNTPHRALVSEDGPYVVTLDTYARLGYAHAVVVYGPDGKLIADYPLERLLTTDEISQKVPKSVSSRWWLSEASLRFRTAAGNRPQFQLDLHWGKRIRIDLTTGEIVDGAPPSKA